MLMKFFAIRKKMEKMEMQSAINTVFMCFIPFESSILSLLSGASIIWMQKSWAEL